MIIVVLGWLNWLTSLRSLSSLSWLSWLSWLHWLAELASCTAQRRCVRDCESRCFHARLKPVCSRACWTLKCLLYALSRKTCPRMDAIYQGVSKRLRDLTVSRKSTRQYAISHTHFVPEMMAHPIFASKTRSRCIAKKDA